MKFRILSTLFVLVTLGAFQPAWSKHSTRSSAPKNKSVDVRSYKRHARSLRRGPGQEGSKRSRPRLSRAQTKFYSRHPRNKSAEEAFERQTGYPHERPGYVADHIVPLACGGRDDPSNMQWQTIADAKAKDKGERKGCK